MGNHELKGLMTYASLGVSDVHFPLMALVDYRFVYRCVCACEFLISFLLPLSPPPTSPFSQNRGFRLVAMSVLPVNTSTLIYGTSDGGRTLHNRDEAFSSKMEV